jgi:hypothetical protein
MTFLPPYLNSRKMPARSFYAFSALISALVLFVLILVTAQVTAQGTLIDPADEDLWQMTGVLEDGGLGYAITSGDLNGDSYDDLIVSAPFATIISGSVTLTESGAVYVFLGPVEMTGTISLPTRPPNLTFFSDCRDHGCPQDWAGSHLSIGDMNNDGLDDLVMGVYRYHGSPGAAFVFVGRETLTASTRISINLNTDSPNTSEWNYSLKAVSAGPEDRMGAVATGDVNGDGHDDLIMGSYRAKLWPSLDSSFYPDQKVYQGLGPFTRTQGGLVYVAASWGGLTTTAETPRDYYVCLDSLTIYGKDGWDHFGRSVASGDVDGDGLADIIVGAEGGDRLGIDGDDGGEVYVFWGSQVITYVEPYHGSPDCDPFNSDFTYEKQIVIDLAYPTQTADITLYGALPDSGAGWAVNSGDLNGDGYADIVIGAPAPFDQGVHGLVHVVYGSARGELSSTIFLSETAGLTIMGEAAGDRFGESVSVADLNADGYEDLIIGAIHANPSNRTKAGKTYVFYGTGGAGLSGTIYLSETNTAHITLWGETEQDTLGQGLAAGDMDHDGILDLLAGAPSVVIDQWGATVGSDATGVLYALKGDAIRGVTLTGELTSIVAGVSVTYTLAAWNQYADWDVTDGSSFNIQTGAGGSCAANVCTATQAGVWSVTGQFNVISDFSSLTVEPAAPDHVLISPPQLTLDPGASQQLAASLYDAYGNLLSASTYEWAVLNAAAGTISASGLFTANQTGVYTNAIQVTADTFPDITDTTTVTVNNLAPNAVISGTNLEAFEGTPLFLDASSSYDVGSEIVSYEWDWDFQESFTADATGVTATKTYTDNGSMTVALRVTDDYGATDTVTTPVNIDNLPPSVQLGGPYGISLDQAVTITSAVSDPGANDWLIYAWDIDNDGQFDDGSGTTFVFTPTVQGLFTITLQVTDKDGAFGSDNTLIVVGNLTPTAIISGTPLSGQEGTPVLLDGSPSYDVADSLTYAWDWNYQGAFITDAVGITSTVVFTNDGIFTTALRVVDTQGVSDTTLATVTVANVPPILKLGGPYETFPGYTVVITSSVFDPGDDAISYAWDLDDNGMFDDAFSSTTTFSATVTGTFTVSLRVADDDSLVSDFTTVTVSSEEYHIFLPIVLQNLAQK